MRIESEMGRDAAASKAATNGKSAPPRTRSQVVGERVQTQARRRDFLPARSDLLAGIVDDSETTKTLLAGVLCRRASAVPDMPLGSTFKIPTWRPDVPVVMDKRSDKPEFGNTWIVLLAEPGEQEESWLAEGGWRYRIHCGREEMAMTTPRSAKKLDYHVVPDGIGLTHLYWTEGCLRVTRRGMAEIYRALSPLKSESAGGNGRGVGYLVVDRSEACAAQFYCAHEYVKAGVYETLKVTET